MAPLLQVEDLEVRFYTKDGEVHHVLVQPHEEVDLSKFRLDSENRLVIPFKKLKSAKDVIVMGPL